MKQIFSVMRVSTILLLCLVVMSGCSGSGKGGSSGSGSGTTVVSGKVTLSGSVISSKAAYLKGISSVPTAKVGSKTFFQQAANAPTNGLTSVLNAPLFATSLVGAKVDLYNADHPEWLYPIAAGSTDANGDYTLSSMSNAANNPGASYRDGDPIPVGKYTLVAYKAVFGQKPQVAVQTVVKSFEGAVTNVDFEVLPSDAAPAVIAMFGAPRSKDGTQTWGGTGTTLPAKAAIQITFSMPMVRETLAAIEIDSMSGTGQVPTGKWTLSADWLTATYYPDAGQMFTAGEVYTVTVLGADDTTSQSQVTNVYGNSIDATAIGTFTAAAADTMSPTIQWNKPTVIEMGTLVDVTQAFRIEANEMLDVNGIVLEGSPSIGAKPGVIFLGRNAAGMYVYEFVLGEPLVLDQGYSIRVFGGKDLSGNPINVLTGSIKTNVAANTPGIDPIATADTQNLQAKVKSVFGRWVRSLNDRNLAQFQSLMTGDFYMEYDTSRGIDMNSDINRDGRFSFAEFSSMIARQAFPMYDYCGTTMTGNVVGSINVVPASDSADFEFTLTASNLINSRSCGEAAPKEHLFATLQYKNGAWRIVRASSGIDTRVKTIVNPDLVTTQLYQKNYLNSTRTFLIGTTAVDDGGIIGKVPSTFLGAQTNVAANYTWDAVQGVSSYVLVIIDGRNPENVQATAFPTTITDVTTGVNWTDPSIGGVDVSSKFRNSGGGVAGGGALNYVEGGRYFWEVIGLATLLPGDIGSKTMDVILKDISAMSSMKSFTVAGVFKELHIKVWPGTSTVSSPLTYSENISGYDVGSAYRATLEILTPSADGVNPISGTLTINGSSTKTYNFTFNPATGAAIDPTTFQPNLTIVLYKGFNSIEVCDSGNPMVSPPISPMCKKFGIMTKGGIPPVIGVWDVTDDLGNTLMGDAYNYFTATSGATKVTIGGGVSDTMIMSLSVSVFNESGANYSATAPITMDGAGNRVYTATVDIYKGNNWIKIEAPSAPSMPPAHVTQLGVYTDTGAVWVPPIAVTSISEAVNTAVYPNSSDWTATMASGYAVTISGKFKKAVNGWYNLWSEGSYQSGTIYVQPDGSFTFTVTLYTADILNGSWNQIGLSYNDPATMEYRWYGLNILTKTGKPVILPKITEVNNQPYNPATTGGTAAVNTCMAKIKGTAEKGNIQVYWNGYNGLSWYSESLPIVSDGINPFTVTMPVVSGPGSYNYIDIYDWNWRRVSVNVLTSASCPFTPPVTAVTRINATPASPDVNGNYLFNAAGDTSVTLSGTTSLPGATIAAYLYACSVEERYVATADASGTWTIPGVKVYGVLNAGSNYVYVSDGYMSRSVNVTTTNTQALPSQPLDVSLVSSSTKTATGCGFSEWNAGASTSVTITGQSTGGDGTGIYYDPINGMHSFPISGGSFSFSVPVYDGMNYIRIYDTKWYYYEVRVSTTTTGNPRPNFVKIGSPSHNGTASGPTAISGTVRDPTATGYSPSKVRATIYNSNIGTYKYFSSDPADQAKGDQPMLYSAGTFSFNYDFGAGTGYSYIRVEAQDLVSNPSIYHGHEIYVNNIYNYSEYYFKPRKAGVDLGIMGLVHTREHLRHIMKEQ